MKKYLNIAIITILIASCNLDKENLNNLNQTIQVRNNNADMPVYLRGNITSKTIILIVHGGPGGNGYQYRQGEWAINLEKKYAIAYWDQRGQGMSQGKYKANKITINQMVEDMNAVVKVLKTKFGENTKIYALGHSWGGTLSAKYVTTKDYQKNINGWIEVDGAHDLKKNKIESVKRYITIANEQIAANNHINEWTEILNWVKTIDTTNISKMETNKLNDKGYKAQKWLREDKVLNKLSKKDTPNSPINPLTSKITGNFTNSMLANEISETALTNELHKITIPVLILWGKYDIVVPMALGYDTYNKISSTNKKIVIFEKSGHTPMLYEWQKFNNAIIGFIEHSN